MINKNLIVTISNINDLTKEKEEVLNLRTSNIGVLIVESVLPKITCSIQDVKEAIGQIELFNQENKSTIPYGTDKGEMLNSFHTEFTYEINNN